MVASCFFYACYIPKYLPVIAGQIILTYLFAIAMTKFQKKKKLILLLGLGCNLSTLLFFKYFNFAAENLNLLMPLLNVSQHFNFLKVALPLGISFHTFQVLAYLFDVYSGKFPVEKHLGYFFIYVLFYPQLVAGPIERPGYLLPQLKDPAPTDFDKLRSGLELMLIGFIKKLVIADNAALLVDPVYSNLHAFSNKTILLATYFFAIQIYCDFSGYVDIARGASRCLGIELSINFNGPYLAKSVAEFWQRWHITLTSWFRDYLFQPLMSITESISIQKLCLCTLVVFICSGFWHGADWHYVAFGLFHGACIVSAILVQTYFPKLKKLKRHRFWKGPYLLWQVFACFHLVLISWVFFRANSMQDAFYVFRRWLGIDAVPVTTKPLPIDKIDLRLVLLTFGVLMAYEIFENAKITVKMPRIGFYSRWTVFLAGLLMIWLTGRFDSIEFVYFKF